MSDPHTLLTEASCQVNLLSSMMRNIGAAELDNFKGYEILMFLEPAQERLKQAIRLIEDEEGEYV